MKAIFAAIVGFFKHLFGLAKTEVQAVEADVSTAENKVVSIARDVTADAKADVAKVVAGVATDVASKVS